MTKTCWCQLQSFFGSSYPHQFFLELGSKIWRSVHIGIVWKKPQNFSIIPHLRGLGLIFGDGKSTLQHIFLHQRCAAFVSFCVRPWSWWLTSRSRTFVSQRWGSCSNVLKRVWSRQPGREGKKTIDAAKRNNTLLNFSRWNEMSIRWRVFIWEVWIGRFWWFNEQLFMKPTK